jgi:transcriptional regulator GlxA family with amidase domain
MPKPLDVAILAFAGCQVLDVSGPAMVFEAGNNSSGQARYNVHILSSRGGTIQTNSAVALVTKPLKALPPRAIDTLLIAGGDRTGLRMMAADDAVLKWAVQTSRKARRYGSVCTGAFALAHFGLLSGKRVATHWSACSELAELCPDAHVDANASFVNDGRLWTSAGVTTGIDMSLAMVASDLGEAVANAIAKRLVLYARRPGYQSQFSPVLGAQSQAAAPFTDLIDWIREHLAGPLDVQRLAARVSMSERTFLRHFTRSIGMTPARFVETLRLDQTGAYLAAGMSLKEIAPKVGYLSCTQLSRAFDRRFGMTPSLFRESHHNGSGGGSSRMQERWHPGPACRIPRVPARLTSELRRAK